MSNELRIEGLSKTYANGVRALQDVTLTIPTGMFGLLGRNGAGKSTLMRTIATLQEADSGSIKLGPSEGSGQALDVLREKDAVRRILGYRQAWSFVVAKLLTDPVWWFFLTWLPDLFKKKWGLDIKKSWVHLVTIYAIITVLSIAGGWLTGYLARRGWSVTRARKTGMFIFACCVLPIFFVTRVDPWPAVLLIGIAGAAHQAWSANLFTTTSDMFPKRAVASVVGVGGMAGGLGGFAFPIFAGALLDKMGTAGYATPIRAGRSGVPRQLAVRERLRAARAASRCRQAPGSFEE